MDNLELNELVYRNVQQNYLGVFSSDMLPCKERLKKEGTFSLIVNLDRHYEAGSHFVSVYSTPKKILYFDSYGLPPFTKELYKFMKDISKEREVQVNQRRIQSSQSILCGLFCAGFLFALDMKLSLTDYISLFSNNYEHNDDLVVYFILSYIKKLRKK